MKKLNHVSTVYILCIHDIYVFIELVVSYASCDWLVAVFISAMQTRL